MNFDSALNLLAIGIDYYFEEHGNTKVYKKIVAGENCLWALIDTLKGNGINTMEELHSLFKKGIDKNEF